MLGFISRFGSSKGMVAVPDFFGLNFALANSQLALAGLSVNPFSGDLPTNNPALEGIVIGQFPTAGALVDYETLININFGKFVADSIQVSGCAPYSGSTSSSGNWCVGTQTFFSVTTTKNRKTIITTNNITGEKKTSFDYSCVNTITGGGSGYVDGSCGYTAPPTTCTKTVNYGAYSACNAAYQVYSSGTQTRTVSGTETNCQPYSYQQSRTCYQAVCGSYGAWGNHPTDIYKQRRTRLCQNTDGSTYFDYEDRCRTSQSVTYGTCNTKTNKKVQTTKNYSCGVLVSTSTASIPCNAQ